MKKEDVVQQMLRAGGHRLNEGASLIALGMTLSDAAMMLTKKEGDEVVDDDINTAINHAIAGMAYRVKQMLTPQKEQQPEEPSLVIPPQGIIVPSEIVDEHGNAHPTQ